MFLLEHVFLTILKKILHHFLPTYKNNKYLFFNFDNEKVIYFGDFHVHSTFSADAMLFSLPIMGGEGVHPVADACDFARYCSNLDFFSINDHAELLTKRQWIDTIDSIQSCDATNSESNPDLTPFLGWEWTQVDPNPENHYGHKNDHNFIKHKFSRIENPFSGNLHHTTRKYCTNCNSNTSYYHYSFK